jgi:two-component system response regulator
MSQAPEIVLAEDNPADAELILHSLEEARPGARVRVVHDGEEALDYLLCRGEHASRAIDAAPRLVLLDIKLPKVSGVEVLRQLKADPRTRAIPVVMLTSSNVERDVVDCYRAGANSYVQKPMAFDRLRAALVAVGAYWLGVNEPVPVRALTEGA